MVHTHSPVTGASVMPRSPHILPIELEPVPRAAGPVREQAALRKPITSLGTELSIVTSAIGGFQGDQK
jgi:hypothetical protein